MIKTVLFILTILLVFNLSAQVNGEVNIVDRDRDVLYLHYTPTIKNDALFGYQKVAFRMGVPPLKINRLTLVNVFGVDYHHFNYNDDAPLILNEVDQIYNINYSLFTSYKLSENWTVNALATPFVLSTFKEGFKINDLRINGNFFAERTFYTKNSSGTYKLSLGMGYLTLLGKTNVVPIVNLRADVNDKLSFALGMPNTYLKYDLNDKHSLKVLADINDFSANVGTPFFVSDSISQRADKVIFSSVGVGVEYHYWLTNSVGIMIRGLYSIYDNFELQDSKNDSVYNFETKSKPYLSVGLKFNPLR